MKRPRNRVPSTDNNRWFERYGQGGFFCLPRALLFNVVDHIDNATLYAYVALASCHFEGNTTYAGPYLTKLTGKDERAIRSHLADLETLGLIRREPFGQGYRILFECPTRERIKQGAAQISSKKLARQQRRKEAAQATNVADD
ncbi:hypothetical protein D9M68_753110 [compost metagenome]